MRTRSIGNDSPWRKLFGWGVCAGVATALGIGLIVTGCGTKAPETGGEVQPPVGQMASGQAVDSFAVPAAIDDSGMVVPGTIHLSKKAGDRVQWKNNSRDTMLIVLQDSHVAELVPPGQLSASHRVCLTCEEGVYSYVIWRMVNGVPMKKGPPTEPQLSVGG
jgi:hypothetical protein